MDVKQDERGLGLLVASAIHYNAGNGSTSSGAVIVTGDFSGAWGDL